MSSNVIPGLTDSDATPTGAGYQPRTLVLLGSGHAHVHLLKSLASKPLVGVQVVLVSPHPRQLVASLLPQFVEGRRTIDDCAIALEPLVQRAGVRWLECSAKGLDAQHQCLSLDNGSLLNYDWLSINTGAVMDRETTERSMPGARTHALFVRPAEGFAALWPRVVALGTERALRVAVVGSGTAAIELACAVHVRLPSAAVTLVCGTSPLLASAGKTTQRQLGLALRQRGITVLQDNAVGFADGLVQLGCGATLACDVPLLATPASGPTWLLSSGLALDAQGGVATQATLRSTSLGSVFATGGVGSRKEPVEHLGGRFTARAGHTLAQNLAAATSGAPLKPHREPTAKSLLVSLGDGRAIGDPWWCRVGGRG
jgi:NADH dehydrogenase FAD-containing subunit